MAYLFFRFLYHTFQTVDVYDFDEAQSGTRKDHGLNLLCPKKVLYNLKHNIHFSSRLSLGGMGEVSDFTRKPVFHFELALYKLCGPWALLVKGQPFPGNHSVQLVTLADINERHRHPP